MWHCTFDGLFQFEYGKNQNLCKKKEETENSKHWYQTILYVQIFLHLLITNYKIVRVFAKAKFTTLIRHAWEVAKILKNIYFSWSPTPSASEICVIVDPRYDSQEKCHLLHYSCLAAIFDQSPPCLSVPLTNQGQRNGAINCVFPRICNHRNRWECIFTERFTLHG
jgi:hypothetical protein